MNRLSAVLTLYIFLMLGVLASGTTPAQSREAYVGGGLALQDADISDDGMAVVARGGVGLPELSQKMAGNWSAEGEITRSLISPEAGGKTWISPPSAHTPCINSPSSGSISGVG